MLTFGELKRFVDNNSNLDNNTPVMVFYPVGDYVGTLVEKELNYPEVETVVLGGSQFGTSFKGTTSYDEGVKDDWGRKSLKIINLDPDFWCDEF